ncbi:hypothetical protein KNE206_02850 [Kitasatospora sp. NE20-6]
MLLGRLLREALLRHPGLLRISLLGHLLGHLLPLLLGRLLREALPALRHLLPRPGLLTGVAVLLLRLRLLAVTGLLLPALLLRHRRLLLRLLRVALLAVRGLLLPALLALRLLGVALLAVLLLAVRVLLLPGAGLVDGLLLLLRDAVPGIARGPRLVFLRTVAPTRIGHRTPYASRQLEPACYGIIRRETLPYRSQGDSPHAHDQ